MAERDVANMKWDQIVVELEQRMLKTDDKRSMALIGALYSKNQTLQNEHEELKEVRGTSVTIEILADALECFWNAALGAQQRDQSPVSCIAEGVHAIAERLKEHSK